MFAFIVALIGILLSRKGLDPQAALAIVGSGPRGLALPRRAVARFWPWSVIWHTGFRGISVWPWAGSLYRGCFSSTPPISRSRPGAMTEPCPTCRPISDDPPARSSRAPGSPSRPDNGHDAAGKAACRGPTARRRPRLYPDLQPLILDRGSPWTSPRRSVKKLIKRRHWKIIDDVRAGGFSQPGISMPIAMSTRDGISGRHHRSASSALGSRTQVDVRSVSRAGWQEQPGSNAARVDELISQIEDAIGDS